MRYNPCYAACGITGEPSPSEADMRLTRRILEASRILQLQLIDHVIIGAPTQAGATTLASKREASFPEAFEGMPYFLPISHGDDAGQLSETSSTCMRHSESFRLNVEFSFGLLF
jgi:RadC-like JAB domain